MQDRITLPHELVPRGRIVVTSKIAAQAGYETHRIAKRVREPFRSWRARKGRVTVVSPAPQHSGTTPSSQHYHSIGVVDGVFEEVAGHAQAHDEINGKASPPSVTFTRPLQSTRPSWPRRKPPCADASCARPPFAMERLRKEGNDLVYRCAKQHSEPTSDKRGAKVDERADHYL